MLRFISYPPCARPKGFTLIELALVLLVLSLLAAAAINLVAARQDADNMTSLNATLDTIDSALLTYLANNNRLPCPANITAYENNTSFGTEIESLADGNCTGANFFNTSTDPDASGGTDPGAPDALYDSATLGKIAAGAVPTKALKLPDRFAYDPWGHKLFYAVDIRMTAANAVNVYPVTSTLIGGIVIKSTYNSALSAALTTRAVYALISVGKNGHGGYVRNPTNNSTAFNMGSTNTDELKNCHCSSSAGATSFDRIFVQKPRSPSTTLANQFDDVVRFRTRPMLSASSGQLQ